jgi:type IV pilus assembly protein PilZ
MPEPRDKPLRLRIEKGAYTGGSWELDSEEETLTLLSPSGENLGSLPWEAISDYIVVSVLDAKAKKLRRYPRTRLAVKVRCRTQDGSQFESLTEGIGGGGLFIEMASPPEPGTELDIELVMPDKTTVPLRARGQVIWTRARPELYTFLPGIGVGFTEISDESRRRLLGLIKNLTKSRNTA